MQNFKAMLKTPRGAALAITLGLVTLIACEGLIDAISQAIIDAAVALVEANGGVAGVAKRGEAFSLEMTDENSPLFGTRVDLSGDALPEDVDYALVSIELSNLDKSPDEQQRRIGTPAEIRLRAYDPERREFDDERRVPLERDARVRVPYDRSAVPTTAATSAVVGHVVDGELELLANAEVDTETGRVSGDTGSFSPFFAVINDATLRAALLRFNPFTGICISETDSGADGSVEYYDDYTVRHDTVQAVTGYTDAARNDIVFQKNYLFNANNAVTGVADLNGFSSLQFFKNSDGQVTQEAQDVFDDGSIDIRTDYFYNAQGRITEATDGFYTYKYTYDDMDRMTRTRLVDQFGDVLECQEYVYENGYATASSVWDTCNKQNLYKEATYQNCPARVVPIALNGLPR